jgi:hypothetical protein
MELRHLRYFIAVAEEGSLLTAAQRRLSTSQPSLSRQIRDLESEVGVKLLERQARGVEMACRRQLILPWDTTTRTPIHCSFGFYLAPTSWSQMFKTRASSDMPSSN